MFLLRFSSACAWHAWDFGCPGVYVKNLKKKKKENINTPRTILLAYSLLISFPDSPIIIYSSECSIDPSHFTCNL